MSSTHEYESVREIKNNIQLTITLEDGDDDMNMTSCEAYGEVHTKGRGEDVHDATAPVYEKVN